MVARTAHARCAEVTIASIRTTMITFFITISIYVFQRVFVCIGPVYKERNAKSISRSAVMVAGPGRMRGFFSVSTENTCRAIAVRMLKFAMRNG